MLRKALTILRELFSAPVDAALLSQPSARAAQSARKASPTPNESQISLVAADLIRAYVVALANSPTQYAWDKCICYVEVSRYPEGDLRVIETGRPYLNGQFIPEPIPVSMESYDALEAYFTFSEKLPNCWTGMGINIDRDGRYLVSFFYDPCLGDPPDHDETERRLDELSRIQ